MPAAFLTGGSGFIGGRLIERLRADGFDVRALARSDGAAQRIRARGGKPVSGDLGSVDAIRDGALGCELAFHAAAALGDWGPRKEFERVNVEGTRNVVRGCAAAGVRRLVHVGTEAALLAGNPLVGVDETAPLRPDSPVLYSSTKARAEQIVLDAVGDDFETVVVRPRFVWGPVRVLGLVAGVHDPDRQGARAARLHARPGPRGRTAGADASGGLAQYPSFLSAGPAEPVDDRGRTREGEEDDCARAGNRQRDRGGWRHRHGCAGEP